MVCKSCEPEPEQFQVQIQVHNSYKTRKLTLSCIGNYEENINLSHIHLAVAVDRPGSYNMPFDERRKNPNN